MHIRTSRAAAAKLLLLLAAGMGAACAPHSTLETRSPELVEETVEQAKAAAKEFLDQRAVEMRSGESFLFESLLDLGPELVLTYRAEHPDWIVRTHVQLVVAYNKSSGDVRFVARK